MSPPMCVRTRVNARTSGGCGVTWGEEHWQTTDYKLEQIFSSRVHIDGSRAFPFVIFEEDIVKNINRVAFSEK
jgi:hypothetical protein